VVFAIDLISSKRAAAPVQTTNTAHWPARPILDTRTPLSTDSPIKLFWSVTVYDVDTRALIMSDQGIAGRSPRMDLRKNDSGSMDIYCDRSWRFQDFDATNR
jgi:hypothetical protein